VPTSNPECVPRIGNALWTLGEVARPVGAVRIFSTIGKTIWGWVGLPNRNNEHPLNLVTCVVTQILSMEILL